MNISEKFKHTFEPELLREIEEKRKIVSINEGDVILEIWQTVRVIPQLVNQIKIMNEL